MWLGMRQHSIPLSIVNWYFAKVTYDTYEQHSTIMKLTTFTWDVYKVLKIDKRNVSEIMGKLQIQNSESENRARPPTADGLHSLQLCTVLSGEWGLETLLQSQMAIWPARFHQIWRF